MPSEPSPKGARRGIRIGKYDVLTHIATGGMGAVYKAVDKDLGREVALKILPPEMAANPSTLERFRREARNAAKLRHENIVTLFEFGEHQGTYFLALEFIDGIDLHEHIQRQGQLEPREACEILRQALLALQHAHQQGIVHRDVKPSNFLLTRKEGRLLVKLTDMGLARQQREEDFRLTRAGSTVGTVDYMSPEQARNSDAADIRSDIYSLGCTLFHMLAGRAPFTEGSMTERLYKHIEDPPPNIRELNHKVPDGLVVILERMLAKRPEDRYQSPSELLEDLLRMDELRKPNVQMEILAGLTESDHGIPVARAVPDSDTEKTDAMAVPTNRISKIGKAALTRAKLDRNLLKSTMNQTAELSEQAAQDISWKLIGAVGGVVLLLLAGIIVAIQVLTKPAKLTEEEPPAPNLPNAAQVKGPAPLDLAAAATSWQVLYKPAIAVDSAGLRKELLAPWAKIEQPATTVCRFSRSYKSNLGSEFQSIESACTAPVAPGTTRVVDVNDNGPIYVQSFQLEQRNLVLRAGKGYRPLLVWDGRYPEKEGQCLLLLKKGNLTLEGLDIAVRWAEKAVPPNLPPPPPNQAALFRVQDGDFQARDCTFSVAGNQFRGGIPVVRLAGNKADNKCRFFQCYARGSQLMAVDVQSPQADVLVERSLVVGDDEPLVRILGRPEGPSTVRVAQSTLVSSQSCVQVRGGMGSDQPVLHWVGWDAILARNGAKAGGSLVELDNGLEVRRLRWKATNCLYAGWQTLVQGDDPIRAVSWPRWRELVHASEGDKAIVDSWPREDRNPDLAQAPAQDYEVREKTVVGYLATPEEGLEAAPIGCLVKALPASRDNWLSAIKPEGP